MKTEMLKRRVYPCVLGSILFFLSGCGTSFQVAGHVAQGRQALLKGDYQGALALFQAAAQVDPQYVWGIELKAGVPSYLGRAQYLTGQLAPAQQTLQQALAERRDDNVAALYLGLTLARQGDNKRGLENIETGMKGIRDLANYVTRSFAFGIGQYWDPNREIRNAIEGDLAMISRGNFDWPTLLANGERLGLIIEEEPDRALRREQADRERQRSD
jgi:tetratricopeptide (TPR) repeat protein